jgi:hypothetical protein
MVTSPYVCVAGRHIGTLSSCEDPNAIVRSLAPIAANKRLTES